MPSNFELGFAPGSGAGVVAGPVMLIRRWRPLRDAHGIRPCQIFPGHGRWAGRCWELTGSPSRLAPGRSARAGSAGRGHRLSLIRTRKDWTGPTELRISITPLSLVPAARPDDLPAPFRELEPEVRRPTRRDVGDGDGEPDAPPRLGRAIVPEPQGTGTDEDIDAGIARLGRALNRVALDEDATIEPDASHPRILIGGGRRGWGRWRWRWRRRWRLKLEGTDVAVGEDVIVTILGPWDTALVTDRRTGGDRDGIDGRAADDQGMGPGRTAVVGERGIEDGAQGNGRHDIGRAGDPGRNAIHAGDTIVPEDVETVGDEDPGPPSPEELYTSGPCEDAEFPDTSDWLSVRVS